jgi:hypothetical protein
VKLRYSIYLLNDGEIVGAMLYRTTETNIEAVADFVLGSIREPLYARYKPPYDEMVVRQGERRVTRRP